MHPNLSNSIFMFHKNVFFYYIMFPMFYIMLYNWRYVYFILERILSIYSIASVIYSVEVASQQHKLLMTNADHGTVLPTEGIVTSI